MAMVRVRHASIFVVQKKVGQMFNNKYSINGGDEPQYGDAVLLGYSDGVIMTNLTANIVIPVKGADVDIAALLLAKSDVDIQIGTIGGVIHQITMRTLKAEFTSDAKVGSLVGDFEFGGGEPKRS